MAGISSPITASICVDDITLQNGVICTSIDVFSLQVTNALAESDTQNHS